MTEKMGYGESYAGQFHITGHKVNSFRTVNDTVVIIKWFVVDYLTH